MYSNIVQFNQLTINSEGMSLCCNFNMAERFPEMARWCLNEQVYKAVNCDAFGAVLKIVYCAMHQLTIRNVKLKLPFT